MLSAYKNQSKTQVVAHKNPFFQIFLTALLKTSYEHRELRIEDFFQPNAQARPTKGNVFFRSGNSFGEQPMNYKKQTTNNELPTINYELRSIKIERLCKTNPIY